MTPFSAKHSHVMAHLHRICLLAFLVAAQVVLGYNGPTPNIILIFTDDMGYGDLGVFHQNERVGKQHSTPNLDRFAEEAFNCEDTTVRLQFAPSRASLLGGLHQGHTKFITTNSTKLCRITTLWERFCRGVIPNFARGKYGLQGVGLEGALGILRKK